MAGKPVFKSFRATHALAGTAQRLSESSILTPEFEFYVLDSNGGSSMYLGGVAVDNTWIPRNRSTIRNFVSENGDHIQDEQFDLREIWIDADTSGDIAIVQYKVLE